MIAIVKDTVTGDTVVKEGIRAFEWAENNWSCDCNRQTLFGFVDFSNYCIGCKRFIVIGAILELGEDNYKIQEFNYEYPQTDG